MFNAITFTEELEEVGFTKEQAQKSVKIWMEIMNYNFVSKADFRELHYLTNNDLVNLRNDMQKMEASIRSDMQKMEANIRKDMQLMEANLRSEFHIKLIEMENRLLIKLGSMMVACVAILGAFINYSK